MRPITNGLLAALSLALLVPAAARASGEPRRHDGLYANVGLGLGGLASKETDPQLGKVEVNGGGASLTLAVGGAPIENFIVAGRLWAAAASEPTFKIGGQKVTTPKKSSLGLSLIGLDLTYYFMPVNIYVSATPGISAVTLDDGTKSETSKNGFGLRLAAGWELFVSDNWALGLNLEYVGSSNKTKDADHTRITTGWFGVGIGVTYN